MKALFSPVMILQVCKKKKMCNGEWLFTKLAYVSCSGEILEVGARCVLPITTKSYSRLKKNRYSPATTKKKPQNIIITLASSPVTL